MKIYLIIAWSVLFTGIISCKKDTANSILYNGRAGIFGIVTNESGTAVEGATVTFGTATTTTNFYGVFTFSDVTIPEKNAVITVRMANYITTLKTIERPTADINNVDISLIPKQILTSFSASAGGTITTSNVKITIPSNGIKTASGSAYNGVVNVYGKYLDPSQSTFSAMLPGSLSAIATSGEEKILSPYGVVGIILEDNAGNPLNLASGSPATLEMTVPAGLQSYAPSTIPLWHLNESTGLWMEDGSAVLTAGKYVGNVTHFSWYITGFPTAPIPLTLTLKDQNGNILPNTLTRLSMNSINFTGTARTNNQGVIIGLVPTNSVLKLDALSPCNTYDLVQNIGPFTAPINLTAVANRSNYGTFSGTMLNCNNQPLSNSYVVISNASTSYTVPTDNMGKFTLSTKMCNAGDTMFAIATFDNAYNAVNFGTFNFSTGNINLGTYNSVCITDTMQYLEYSIDNGPLIKFYSKSPADNNDTAKRYDPDYFKRATFIFTTISANSLDRSKNEFSHTFGQPLFTGAEKIRVEKYNSSQNMYNDPYLIFENIAYVDPRVSKVIIHSGNNMDFFFVKIDGYFLDGVTQTIHHVYASYRVISKKQ